MNETPARPDHQEEVTFRIAAHLLQMRTGPQRPAHGADYAAHPDWSVQEIRRLIFLRHLYRSGYWKISSE